MWASAHKEDKRACVHGNKMVGGGVGLSYNMDGGSDDAGTVGGYVMFCDVK